MTFDPIVPNNKQRILWMKKDTYEPNLSFKILSDFRVIVPHPHIHTISEPYFILILTLTVELIAYKIQSIVPWVIANHPVKFHPIPFRNFTL